LWIDETALSCLEIRRDRDHTAGPAGVDDEIQKAPSRKKIHGAPRFPLENAIKLDEMTCAF